MIVIGFGEKKTPKPFISACDKFIYLEILNNTEEAEHTEAAEEPENSVTKKTEKPKRKKKSRSLK
jgi:hypothetical protein